MSDCRESECARIASRRGWCEMHYRRWMRRGGDPSVPHVIADPEARWWSRVDRGGSGDCWPWTGAVDTDGYGRFSVDGATVRATRWGYARLVGPLAEDLFVCHHCDNPSCCNPSHWFLGSPARNSADMTEKERQARGELHGRAKLTTEDVANIRRRYELGGASYRSLAAEFGVAPSLIERIIKRRAWR